MGAPATSAPVKVVAVAVAAGVLGGGGGAAWERWGNRGVLSKPAEVTVCSREKARWSWSSSGGNHGNGLPHASGSRWGRRK